jgi:hypothetical protein
MAAHTVIWGINFRVKFEIVFERKSQQVNVSLWKQEANLNGFYCKHNEQALFCLHFPKVRFEQEIQLGLHGHIFRYCEFSPCQALISSTNTTRGTIRRIPLAINPCHWSRISWVNVLEVLSGYDLPYWINVAALSSSTSRNLNHSFSFQPKAEDRVRIEVTIKTTSRFWYCRKLSNWIPTVRSDLGLIMATHLILSRAPHAANRLMHDRGPNIHGELGPRC